MSAARAIPGFAVRLDGASLDDTAERSITSIRVSAIASQPSQCEVVLVLRSNEAPSEVEIGRSVEVEVAGDRGVLFEGEVTAVEVRHQPDGETELRFRAYDRLHRLRKRQTLRRIEHTNPHDLAAMLVDDLGCKVEGGDDGPEWSLLLQHRQSDLELLQEACRTVGTYFSLRGETLHLYSLDGIDADDACELELGTSLIEACIDVNGDGTCRSVTAQGWSTVDAKGLRHEERDPRSGREVEASAAPDRFEVDGAVTLVDLAGEGADEIEHAAQSELDRRMAREVVLRGTARGDAGLRPGTAISVSGTAGGTAGRYVLMRTTHTLDGRGYLCEVDTDVPARTDPSPSGGGVTLAVVVDVSDPESRGRVRVSLPAYGDLESDWVGVVIPGAGRDKGVVALADVGDTVVVAVPHGDPTQLVVLGGLYGTVTPPDDGVVDGSVQRYSITTPGGQRAVFDDGRQAVRLEIATGSFVELAPEQVVLHARTDVTIEAPGHQLSIRAKRVDFVEAPGEED